MKGRDTWCDKLLWHSAATNLLVCTAAATSRCHKTLIWCTQSILKERKCKLVKIQRGEKLNDAPSSVDLNFVAVTCRRRVHTLQQGCLRLFCRCVLSYRFKPVWIHATDHSYKILSQRQWLSHVTWGDFLQQPVAVTCRSDLSHRVSCPECLVQRISMHELRSVKETLHALTATKLKRIFRRVARKSSITNFSCCQDISTVSTQGRLKSFGISIPERWKVLIPLYVPYFPTENIIWLSTKPIIALSPMCQVCFCCCLVQENILKMNPQHTVVSALGLVLCAFWAWCVIFKELYMILTTQILWCLGSWYPNFFRKPMTDCQFLCGMRSS